MSQPTLAIFTGPKGLGNVFREQHQINVKFSEFVVPFSDIQGNAALNWKGKVKTILIQGAHAGKGFDGVNPEQKLGDFVFEMEEWVRGSNEPLNVQASTVYTDSFGGQYNVRCFDFTWTRSFNDPNRVLYSLMIKVV